MLKNNMFMASVAVVAGIAAMILVPLFSVIQLERWQCKLDWEKTSYEWDTTVTGTCLVKTPQHGWVPAKNFRGAE